MATKLAMTLHNTFVFYNPGIEVYFILVILGVPIFLLSKWILKKWIKVEKTRKITTWVATLIATPMVYVGIVTLIMYLLFYYPKREFEREKWLTTAKEKRYEFSENIVNSNMLVGKTKKEIQYLLGDEDNGSKSDVWRYYLGFVPGALIDPIVLHIEFKDGKVIKVVQYET